MEHIIDLLLEWGDAGFGVIALAAIEGLRQCHRERRAMQRRYQQQLAHLMREAEQARRELRSHAESTQRQMVDIVSQMLRQDSQGG